MNDSSVSEALKLIKRIKDEVNSHRRNIASQWDCKQDLYLIKWACEQAIEQCKTYKDEREYVKKYEHYRLIEKIKGTEQ